MLYPLLATFGTIFLSELLKRTDGRERNSKSENYSSRAVLITFGAILLSEWGDIGQIMAATLSARYQLPLVVWLGATLALMTKGSLALALGRGLRRFIPLQVLRPLSVSLCLIMGVVSAIWPTFDARVG